ncbi:MAG: hypothetical protein OHK003_13680 [Anaerolineales bacterium]
MDAIEASDRSDAPLRAFIAVNHDDVMRQAHESAERFKNGKPLSVFDGVPVAVKDEMDVTPYPTTVGTSFLGKSPAQEEIHYASLPYDEIPHYLCCSDSVFNRIPAENMVAFFAKRGETWRCVELGNFR